VYSKGQIREQLFNLEQDPGEMDNLAVKPKYKKQLAQMNEYLKAWCKKNRDPFGKML
jgi:choline-sulfatase